MNTIEALLSTFYKHIQNTFNLDDSIIKKFDITVNTDLHKQQFGDISTNAPLVLAKSLGNSPRTIAQEIISKFTHPLIKKIEIAGAGFINIFLDLHAFQRIAQELYTNKQLFFKSISNDQAQSYSIEFVSANPTGPLHLGHGRGGIIGDVLSNILRFAGHKVTKEFYINDAGKQIKTLGNSFKIRCLQQLGFQEELPEDAYHGNYLLKLADDCIAHFGKDTILSEKNNPQFFEKYAQDQLLKDIQKTLQFYGINFDVWFSETVLHNTNAINKVLTFLEKSNHTYNQDNALWFRSTEFGDDKDRVLKRSNGELTYVAADIAYLQDKITRKFDKLIMILGQDHHGYTARLHAALQALGHNKSMLDVIIYQLVTLKDKGETIRMSKRSGKSVDLQYIIETVGTDVARFFYLNKKADAHLEFDIDLALKKTEENPVYYIQYAYVRTKSILAKAEINPELDHINENDTQYITDQEALLLKKIISLKSLLKNITLNYQTHLLSYYTIELAQAFHSYYGAHRIIDIDNINQTKGRLLLVKLIQNTLGDCFDLLGISAPQSM